MSTTPTVADGVVYVGSDKELMALDAASGERVWAASIDAHVLSQPVVISTVVYVVSERGTIWAIAASDGQVLWYHHVGEHSDAVPEVSDGRVFAGTRFGAGHQRSVVAMDAKTGSVLWSREATSTNHNSAVLANTFLLTSGERIRAYDPATGDLRWESPVDAGNTYAPISVSNGLAYLAISSGAESVVAVNVDDGSLAWQAEVGPDGYATHARITPYDGTLYMVNVLGELLALG